MIFVRGVIMMGVSALLVGVTCIAEAGKVVVPKATAAASSFVCSATSVAIIILCLVYYVVVIYNHFTFNFEVIPQS